MLPFPRFFFLASSYSIIVLFFSFLFFFQRFTLKACETLMEPFYWFDCLKPRRATPLPPSPRKTELLSAAMEKLVKLKCAAFG